PEPALVGERGDLLHLHVGKRGDDLHLHVGERVDDLDLPVELLAAERAAALVERAARPRAQRRCEHDDRDELFHGFFIQYHTPHAMLAPTRSAIPSPMLIERPGTKY